MGDPATAAAGTDDILGNSTKRTLEKYDLVSVSADNSAPGASLAMAKDLNKANKQVVAVEKEKKSEYYQLYSLVV